MQNASKTKADALKQMQETQIALAICAAKSRKDYSIAKRVTVFANYSGEK